MTFAFHFKAHGAGKGKRFDEADLGGVAKTEGFTGLAADEPVVIGVVFEIILAER
jgi:hypothetical protein